MGPDLSIGLLARMGNLATIRLESRVPDLCQSYVLSCALVGISESCVKFRNRWNPHKHWAVGSYLALKIPVSAVRFCPWPPFGSMSYLQPIGFPDVACGSFAGAGWYVDCAAGLLTSLVIVLRPPRCGS